MFSIYGGATEFKQWELDKLVMNPCMKEGDEVVFHGYGKVYEATAFLKDGEVVADVPNFLLQKSGSIRVDLGWGLDCHLDCRTTFTVVAQEKPDDYVCKYNLPDRSAKSGGSGDTSAPSDWNAAEGEPGHVLNRTHWVDVTDEYYKDCKDVVIPAGTDLANVDGLALWSTFGDRVVSEGNIGDNSPTLWFEFDGAVYELEPDIGMGDNYEPIYHYGNTPEYPNEDIPFGYSVGRDDGDAGCHLYLNNNAVDHVMSIFDRTAEYHPLPKELGGTPVIPKDTSGRMRFIGVNKTQNDRGKSVYYYDTFYLDEYAHSATTVFVYDEDESATAAAYGISQEYRYLKEDGVATLRLKVMSGVDAASVANLHVVFVSGATAPTINNEMGAYFKGDDCADGVFAPVANKTYDIDIRWNGLRWIGVVIGI